ncbi:adhesion regulating molecule [Pluteus cervinus]|uniref:Adhesion regulating molecule n=1 Tax=Pluteus cervinus TaxID=181527 RepID=A0ACD3B6F8_9AGAR|nr:adhesion regulating molecule [Pluteus cervinus]
MSETLLAFKAGRAFRREGTNIVESSPEKGAISLSNGEDGLLHFMWQDRTTNQIEEDLILFPSDASFVKVSQSPSGKVYVLKFSSSNQRHFFWMQDASSTRDEEFANNLNGLLQDPEYFLQWNTNISSSQAQASTSGSASSSSAPIPSNPSNPRATQEQVNFLRELLSSVTNSTAPPDLSLADLLTPANLTPLFTDHPELIPALFPHLPPDLPGPPSAEALQRIVSSPQFRAAVAHFDQALRTGLLGNMVRGLGLPDEAGSGVVPFLRAVQEQADRERNSGGSGSGGGSGEDTMDTD